MAGLPEVQKVRMAQLAAMDTPRETAPPAQANNGIAGMTPGQKPGQPSQEGAVNEEDFAVNRAEPGAGPSASGTEGEGKPAASGAHDYEAESRENYHKWKTVAGMYEKSKDDIAALREELKDLKESIKATPAPARAPAVVDNVPDEELTDQERATYENAFPVINKLSKRQSRQMMQEVIAPLQEKIKALEAGNTSVAQTIKDSDERAFYSTVQSKVPNMNTIINKPEWKEYLSQRVPYTEYNIGQALARAHEGRDLDRVAEIFNGFKPAGVEDINQMVTPSVGASATPASITVPKSNLRWSERTKASQDFRKGRISKERMAEITTIYDRAAQENRIDYNA